MNSFSFQLVVVCKSRSWDAETYYIKTLRNGRIGLFLTKMPTQQLHRTEISVSERYTCMPQLRGRSQTSQIYAYILSAWQRRHIARRTRLPWG